LIRDLEQIERTTCDCQTCKAFCRTSPGDLAPGDVERIAEYLGVEPSDHFLHANFVACRDHKLRVDNKELTIPTIIPAQKPDGRCVFLTSDERCSIHPVAPFGCAKFNACEADIHADYERMVAMLRTVFGEDAGAYLMQWAKLETRGHVAEPLEKRQTKFALERKRATSPPTAGETNPAS
jgi:Fe-S-cluster containining protein